ncbi:MAG: DUF1080 domain-containing protein [Verrucomicrobiota bacterium]
MNKIIKIILSVHVVLLLLTSLVQADEDNPWIELIGDQGLSLFREPLGEWVVVGEAKMGQEDEKLLATSPGKGVVTNGNPGKTRHLFSKMEHKDLELKLEFMIPKKSNSGIYFMGRYEVQIYDSKEVEDPKHYHCGGIYQRWNREEEFGFEGYSPRVNAARKAGQWQSYHIIFRAPRFDETGKKISNAKFVKVIHNDIVIHENQEVTGPTRAAAFKDEKPAGPLMIQGDHGPIALRNIRIRHLMLN